jgi:uncharacterized protein
VCTVNKRKLIIAAIASRAYVQAAVEAGFVVVAIDAFVDVDTQCYAKQCYQVNVVDNRLDKNQLLNVLDGLDLQQFVGFCYGAGFEQTPVVLTEISKRIPLLGNTAKAVAQCKAMCFFKQCDDLNIPHPPVRTKHPVHSGGWIQKEIGGSGGGHVKPLSDVVVAQADNIYYQKFQEGKPISCLFLAGDDEVQVIGFNEQWLEVNAVEPFRYGGAVSNVEISELAKMRFKIYVSKLSQAIGLVGLNSCDAICHGDDVYILEINPRLSATIDLYAPKYGDLMAAHVAACQNNFDTDLLQLNSVHETSKAHQVIYAKQDGFVIQDIIWPSWVSDKPKAGSYFAMGLPVCTVTAEAETSSLAKDLAQERAITIYSNYLN